MNARRPARLLMGGLYVIAGLQHFVITRRYVAIMPPYFSRPRDLVLISGIAEIAGGLGVPSQIPFIRQASAWVIIALLVSVFPANVYMVTGHQNFPSIPLWIAVLRLPLQLPLIYWAWRYTRNV